MSRGSYHLEAKKMWLDRLGRYVDSDGSLVKKKTLGKNISLGDVSICMKDADADAYKKMSWWKIVTKVTFVLKGSYEYVYLEEFVQGC